MAKYNHREIEKKWQEFWSKNETFKASNNSKKPKYYVLDMFPYPSGSGLHVGHPLGYIASDIYARYKRHKGFNVLHPQGYDSFGLPAEQYAIETGQHPSMTTKENIETYRKQLDKMGFSYDWSREVRTSNPKYYKWTQWVFIQLFNSWYNKNLEKAEDISRLISIFEKEGNTIVRAASDDDVMPFTSDAWKSFSSIKRQEILLKYRLAFLSETEVNWCPYLKTVLANDEIVNGVSERGGHRVVRKKMTQWSMRISAYSQRLLDGLSTIDWPQPLKDSQANWIGRSQGVIIYFKIANCNLKIEVFTTRPDTIFGVSFITLAPEHELVGKITVKAQKEKVERYIEATASRSERDRISDIERVSGEFTGAYAIHPFTDKKIQIWIGDYVLLNYGKGAVMSVPCGDQRDYDFAKYFNISIPNIFENTDISEKAFVEKGETKLINSSFLNGMSYKKAVKTVISELEKRCVGYEKINYRMHDAVFSRQRYWGEPFPVYYVNGMPQMIDEKHLPIKLPKVEKYLPTEDGKPPLGNAEIWAWDTKTNTIVSNDKIDNKVVFPMELNTMPGWAGSSWYFNRYMDVNNDNEFASKESLDYWKEVDLYIGGSEHATGHLLYSRFWQKFLYDRGFVPADEYAKKMINQGMILGRSAFIYVISCKADFNFNYNSLPTVLVSSEVAKELKQNSLETKEELKIKIEKIDAELSNLYCERNKGSDIKVSLDTRVILPIHVDISLVNTSDELDMESFKNWSSEFKDAIFISEENGTFKAKREVEKMSKSKLNVINPDDICEEYGADSLRLFEMFLGPLEQSKPWNTAGISGVYSFLKKLWRLFHSRDVFEVSDSTPTKGERKTLHKTIKKVEEDIESFSFNTSVSTFMIAVNELTALKCNKRAILEPLLVLISPYAPHIAEELWSKLGYKTSISTVTFPKFDAKYLVENTKNYPISFNGKMRFTLNLSLDLSKHEIEKIVMTNEKTQAQLKGRIPKKVIIVPGKIVNIVG